MAHGSPDWSKYLRNSRRFSVQDLGEMAARLGSPDTFDRRGEVLFYDVFDHGLTSWNLDYHGTGAVASIVASGTIYSGYAAQLTPGTDGDMFTQLLKYVGAYQANRCGIEAAFTMLHGSYQFSIGVTVFDGVNQHYFSIGVDAVNNQLFYEDYVPHHIVLDNIPQPWGQPSPQHYLKIVGDASLNRYIRAIYDGREYDMSGIVPSLLPNSSTPQLGLSLQATGTAGAFLASTVSHAIVTLNEP